MRTPFDPDVRAFNNKFVKITAHLHYDLYNPYASVFDMHKQVSEDLGKRCFYGFCSISDDLTVVNLRYDCSIHPIFFDNVAYDNYKLQIIMPGAGIIILFNFKAFDLNNIEIGDDQFQSMDVIEFETVQIKK